MAQTAPARRPFPLPQDIGAEAARSVTRAATAALLNQILSPNEGRGERILKETWPSDHRALAIVTRAATAPATTTTAGWAAELSVVGPSAAFLVNLPVSAASQLFARSLQLPLDNVASIKVPYPAATPSLAPSFVAEGAPIPLRQASVTTVTLGPSRKLAVLTALTNEIAEHSTPVAEVLIRGILVATTATALDAAVFSTTAGSASVPAGILNGVTPLTATAGGGATALLGDMKLLAAALATAGAGGQIMIFASPTAAAAIPILVPGYAGIEIIATPTLAAGTVVAIDPAGVVSGTAGQPRIDVGKSTAVHYEDTTPLQISSGTQGSGVLATPVRSAFQTDSFVLRLTLDCSWAARPGFVQFIPSTTW